MCSLFSEENKANLQLCQNINIKNKYNELLLNEEKKRCKNRTLRKYDERGRGVKLQIAAENFKNAYTVEYC